MGAVQGGVDFWCDDRFVSVGIIFYRSDLGYGGADNSAGCVAHLDCFSFADNYGGCFQVPVVADGLAGYSVFISRKA